METSTRSRTDFVSCSQCGATYPAYRSSVCPHPIPQVPVSRLICERSVPAAKDKDGYPLAISDSAITVGAGTSLAIIPKDDKDKRKRKGKHQGPHILDAPYYQRQAWEKVGQGYKRWTAFSHWMSLGDDETKKTRSYAQTARDLGYKAAQTIEDWARQDNWPLRLEAFLTDQANAELRAFKKAWKRRGLQVLALGDSILNILAAEADGIMKNLVANAGTMTVKELNDAYISLGKFFELLQGRATEHVTHDTPEMKRQEQLRSLALDIHAAVEADRRDGLAEDDVPAHQREYIRLGAIRYKLPEDLIAIAVTSIDRVDQQSDSVS